MSTISVMDIDLDHITLAQWRRMSELERHEYLAHWARKGHVAYGCLCCGYPVAHGLSCKSYEERESVVVTHFQFSKSAISSIDQT